MQVRVLKGAIFAAAAGLLLSGCQTVAPRPVPVAAVPAVRVPEARPHPRPTRPQPPPRRCVPTALAGEPRYPDTDTALRNAGGAADRYQLIAAGRLLRIERLRALERVVAGCR